MNGAAPVAKDFLQIVRKWALQHGVLVPPGAIPEHDLPRQDEAIAETAAQDPRREGCRGTDQQCHRQYISHRPERHVLAREE